MAIVICHLAVTSRRATTVYSCFSCLRLGGRNMIVLQARLIIEHHFFGKHSYNLCGHRHLITF